MKKTKMKKTKTANLISINQAVASGIERLRLPIWSTPEDHIKIDIAGGRLGPRIHPWALFNTTCNGRDPVDILRIGGPGRFDEDGMDWEVYTGPLPDSEGYTQAVARYAGFTGTVGNINSAEWIPD